MAKQIELSKTLLRAVNTVCNAVAGDFYSTRAIEWAEIALDAGRLTDIARSPEAEAELRTLIDAHGWDKVLRAVAKHTNYA